jgi:hypothetical protein
VSECPLDEIDLDMPTVPGIELLQRAPPRPTRAISRGPWPLSERSKTVLGLLIGCALLSGARAETPDAGTPIAGDAGPAKSPSIVIEETDNKAEPPVPTPVGEEKRAIGDYIQGHSDGVHDCYSDRIRTKPTLQGKIIVRFQIGPNGRVIGALAEGIADSVLISCVVTEVRKWEFDRPASGGKLRANYPYVFKPITN